MLFPKNSAPSSHANCWRIGTFCKFFCHWGALLLPMSDSLPFKATSLSM